jgi:subtilisin-like proprotein convertase family protein
MAKGKKKQVTRFENWGFVFWGKGETEIVLGQLTAETSAMDSSSLDKISIAKSAVPP